MKRIKRISEMTVLLHDFGFNRKRTLRTALQRRGVSNPRTATLASQSPGAA